MYDINYFSIYRKKRGKRSGFKIFLIIFALLFILGNAALVFGYYQISNAAQARIDRLEAEIRAEAMQQKIAEAARIRQESVLTGEYLKLLKSSTDKLGQLDYLDTALIDKVRALTPATTYFTFAEYNGYRVTLDCVSTQTTDPMDMYHAFLEDRTFVHVTLTGITVNAQGHAQFSIICLLAGGDQQ